MAKSSYDLLLKFKGMVNLVPKILVLYYSRTGNTKKMAEAVSEIVDKLGRERSLELILESKNSIEFAQKAIKESEENESD